MATPFIIKKGLEASLPSTKTSGVMYFCTEGKVLTINIPITFIIRGNM